MATTLDIFAKKNIDIQILLQDSHFNEILVSLRRHSSKLCHGIWDCLNATNIKWQLNTFFICHQREDNVEQTIQVILSDKFQTCEVCKQVGHEVRRCPQTKIAFQKRRLTQAYNPRKDNQLGAYANLEPFDKLTDIMIPHDFF